MANDAIAYAGLKEAREADLQSRQSSDRVARLNKAFARATTSRSDTVQSIEEIAEKLAPPSGVNASHFAQLFVTHETPQPALAAVAAPAPIAAIARPAARQPVPSAQR
jgi:hypothetical protein